jgi:hypothetical protein
MPEMISCSAVLRLDLHAHVLEKVGWHDTACGNDDNFVGDSHELAALLDNNGVLRNLPHLGSHHNVQPAGFPGGLESLAIACLRPRERIAAV